MDYRQIRAEAWRRSQLQVCPDSRSPIASSRDVAECWLISEDLGTDGVERSKTDRK